MFRTLVKKQVYEIFKAYFINPKTNKKRSLWGTAAYISLFVVLLVGVVGGAVTVTCAAIAKPLFEADCGWLYYAITSIAAVLFGTLGSVFSTYSGMYLAKDNDLLLSLPVPTHVIISARLFGVYLTGLMYSAIISLPAAAVYFATAEFTALSFLGGIANVFFVSVFVLILSCGLGYVVARISVKLKNKSYMTVIIALVAIAAYYFVYYKISGWTNELIVNAAYFGADVKEKAYFIYMIGIVGQGHPLALLVSAVAHAALLYLTVFIVSRSFLRVASAVGTVLDVKSRKAKVKKRSPLTALVAKEAKRFTSSPTFMLNSGFGLLFVAAIAVGVFFVKDVLLEIERSVSEFMPFGGLGAAIATIALCLCASTCIIVTPSVSLEGKSIWVLKSLPVEAKDVLKAKILFQILVVSPVLFVASVCASACLASDLTTALAVIVLPQAVFVFMTLVELILGVKMANLNWTNEVVPIKQNFNVLIAMLVGFALCPVIALPYLFLYPIMSVGAYALTAAAVVSFCSFFLYRYIRSGLSEAFSVL